MTGKRRHFDLLKDPDVRRWYNNIKEGSQITADTSIRRLGLFCEFIKKSPGELLNLSDKERNDLLVDFIGAFRNHDGKERSGSYLQALIKPVRSWYAFHGVPVTRKVKIKGTNARPSLKNERVPTQDELKNIFLAGDSRERLACAIMAFSGVRPQVLGNYTGSDGLRVSDIPDMEIKEGTVSFTKVPVRLVVRSELSKKDNEYFSFIGEEGARYLKLYLEERMKDGEQIRADSPIITPSKKAIRESVPFIATTNIGDLIRNTIRRSGLIQRPYVLRKYFDTQLLQAESKTGLKRDYRVFWMGHTGDMEHEYTLNHGILPETVIDDMRVQYAKAVRYLETEEHGIKEEDVAKITNNTMKETALMILETAYGMNLTDKEREELMGFERDELLERLKQIFRDKKAQILNNGNKHKTIPERDLETYLNQGWELVQIYPRGDKAVIKLPS
ncbi:MAG: site-specific integrase [Candidatus Thermoplasmatota archaeon]|nr:site-specific integrase [Candidatus Thermoplasmatota archaeon]